MTTIRKAAVAGLFYPDDAQQLQSWFKDWMPSQTVENLEKAIPRALIVPHAGYVYSGQAAAKAYQSWQNSADKIKTVVVIGPAHRVAFEGITTLSVDALETPLGHIDMDTELRETLLQKFNHLTLSDFAQREEHSIEVQLPFIKYLLPNTKVLPLLNGQVDALDVTAILDYLWQQEGVYFVISSDLSHFHTYEKAQKMDQQTAKMIEHFDWQNLTGERACGYKGIQSILALKSKIPILLQQLELINSGDTLGDRQRVVGYGAWAVFEEGS